MIGETPGASSGPAGSGPESGGYVPSDDEIDAAGIAYAKAHGAGGPLSGEAPVPEIPMGEVLSDIDSAIPAATAGEPAQRPGFHIGNPLNLLRRGNRGEAISAAAEEEVSEAAVSPSQEALAQLRDIRRRSYAGEALTAEEEELLKHPDIQAGIIASLILDEISVKNEPPRAVKEKGRVPSLLWEGLKRTASQWWKNVDPRYVIQHAKEDKIWAAAFAVGVLETKFSDVLIPIPGLNGYARAGLNFAIVNGGHLGINIARGYEERKARQRFDSESQGVPTQETAERFETEQERIANKYSIGHSRLKRFGLGLSAGVTYGSLGISIGGILEATGHQIPNPFEGGIHGPEITNPLEGKGNPFEGVGQALEGAKSHLPGQGPTEAGVPSAVPGGGEAIGVVPEPSGVTQSAAEAAFGHEAIVTGAGGTAETVGAHLQVSSDIVNEALKAQGINPTSLSVDQYEAARLAVQHQMESLANDKFAEGVQAGDLSGTLAHGQQLFDQALQDQSFHEQAVKAAQDALAQGGVEPHEAVRQILENLPQGSMHEVSIPSGTTVGQILHNNGYNVTWGPKDADMFGSHIAANYDLLTDMWGKMATSQHWPEGMHYPVDLNNLSDLVEKAKGGDMIALQKLKDALHWIPAGGKFNVIDPARLAEARQVLKAA